MNKRKGEIAKQIRKEANQQVQTKNENTKDVGEKLLQNKSLTLTNMSLLVHRIAETENYTKEQLIVCKIYNLDEQLNSRKSIDLENKPIFTICASRNEDAPNEDAPKAAFCLFKLKNQEKLICLYKDFLNNKVPDYIKTIIEQNFGPEIEFKVSFKSNEIKNKDDQDILFVNILKTMMIKLKASDKESFVKDFDNPRRSYFDWLKGNIKILKDELFSLVKEGYYKTLASDIDQLSMDTEFKKAVKELINSIPLLDQIDNFRQYQKLLTEFVALEESEHDDDIIKQKMKETLEQIEITRKNIFANIKDINIKMSSTSDNKKELEIIQKFPNQMAKFTKIFEPLARAVIDDNLDKELKQISDKLDLDFAKLKSFFQVKEMFSEETTETHFRTRNIQELMFDLPNLRVKSTTDTQSQNKSFEQLLKEIELSELKSDYLVDGYKKVKSFYANWKNKDAYVINHWIRAKKGRLNVSEIFEAVAVIDCANEHVTGGHTLRDTQILSILCFLQQNDKGMLSQISTGEGKTTIVAVLAAIKVLLGEFVDVITSNPILADDAVKDKKLFFEMLDISVETNNLDPKYTSGERNCYKADIVYGNISNYQFDFLKDSFLGLGTRGDRPFNCLILDEVDSMIIDNASHIAKLAGPLPGMDSLKYIYIKIWQELHKAEKIITEDIQKQLDVKAKELNAQSMDKDEAQAIYENLKNMLECAIPTRVADHIKESNPTNIKIIPSHLRVYVDNTLDKWINSAINAMYPYDEDEQYVIRLDAKSNEKVVQPIDYANTGVTLKNTIWQYGLHQFLQLKHNLHLTSENLTSCFISNLGYINKYGNKIFGLTGTLGSKAEQDLLSSIYNVSFANIPTYKEKKFVETEGDVVPDNIFHYKVADDAAREVSNGRSSLIICETIKDAKAITKILEEKFHSIKTRTFFDENHAQVTEKEINPCEVVIATNIAGRGTDFKTTIELESNGGLQVCVAFLPCNKRVEDQAFGRTARQGNNGTAKLVIRKSEIEKLGVNTSNFEMIKSVRDEREAERIKQIREVKIIELTFQDELFEKFATLFKKLKDINRNKTEHRYVLDDLKEYWAFWLEINNFKGAHLKEKNVGEEFDKFKSEANDIIKGQIKHNPYNSIQQAEHFITVENFDAAKKAVDSALAICENSEILHSAYIKLFEISIERGEVLKDKFKNALSGLIIFGEINPDQEYKQKAIRYLELAITAFNKEKEYIEELYKTDEFTKILISTENNLFLKQIISKQGALDLYIQQAKELIKQIKAHRGGISIICRKNDYFANIKPDTENERKIIENVNKSELSELAAIGTNATHALREVHDVPDEILTAARAQIITGIALCATGICFPPALPVTSSIGGTLITEGICDVAIELINKSSDGQFHQEAFIKGKVITLCISMLTLGINTALQCPKILEKARKACRWLSSTLRRCPYLRKACANLAIVLDKLGDILLRLIQLSDSQIANITQTLSVIPVSVNNVVRIKSVKNTVMQKVEAAAWNLFKEKLKSILKKTVFETVNKNIDKKKLKCHLYDDIQNIIKEIRDSIDLETVKDLFKEIKNCSYYKVELVFDKFNIWQKVCNYIKNLCEKLNAKLKSGTETTDNNVERLINQIVDQFTDKIYDQFTTISTKTREDVNSENQLVFNDYQRKQRLQNLCSEINKVFNEGYATGQEQARAASDVIKRPIEIYEENGNIILIGERHPGKAVKVYFFGPDDQNHDGHYVPIGKDKTYFKSKDSLENNCLFEAIAVQIERDPAELRKTTIKKLESDPFSYIAPKGRDIFDMQMLIESGAHDDNKFVVDRGRIEVLVELLPIAKEVCEDVRKHEIKKPYTLGKNGKSVCLCRVEFNNAERFECYTVSDDEEISLKAKNGFKLINPKITTTIDNIEVYKTIYDVYNHEETTKKYTKCCPAQKIYHGLAEFMKANTGLKIKGNIQMIEVWIDKSDDKFEDNTMPNQNQTKTEKRK